MHKALLALAIPGLLGDVGPSCSCGPTPPDDSGSMESEDGTTSATGSTSLAETTVVPLPDLGPLPDLPVDDECEELEAPWNGVEPDAADCTEDGLTFCSNVEEEGPAGSRFWECMGGTWVESDGPDESCLFDGFDFGYGCYDDGSAIVFVCGLGPGTPCSGPECDACGPDGDAIDFCVDGKLGRDSCFRICTEDGDDQGVTYDYGACETVEDPAVIRAVSQCVCCDAGDPGCPA